MENRKLGEKIRFHRKLLNLSQKELAEKLYVTPQNLSKWENGLSNPDIWNLYKISEVLNISCDYLLGKGEHGNNAKIFLAVDGGATKTEFLLFYETGEILKRLVLPGTNPNSCGMDKTLAVLKNGMDSIISSSCNLSGAFLGIAGCGNQRNKKSVLNFLEQNYLSTSFDVQSDLYNVIHTEMPAENYISVVCGTGSVVGIKTPDSIYAVGGFGYLFDSAYCGYTLGKEAILATLKYENRIGQKTVIADNVEEIIGGRALDEINNIYKAGKDYIASFAHTVFDAFDKGDAVALRIVDKSASELGELINYASEKYGNAKDVVLSGGVTKRADILIPCLKKYCRDINFIVSELPQVYGAAICCCQKYSSLSEDFKNNLQKSYKECIERG